MKIALLTPNKTAHTETFIANHIKHLPFDITVVYGGNFPTTVDGFSVSKIDTLRYKLKKKIYAVFNKPVIPYKELVFKKILKKYHIEHVFCEYLLTGAAVTKACRSMQIPLSAIALGFEISRYDVIERNKDAYRALFEYAATLFVVSNHMKRQMLKLGCPEDKIKWTPAGPDVQFFDIIPERDSQQFFALGRFVAKKAPHLTIVAFSKVLSEFPEATLVLGGDGTLLEFCKDLVKALELQDAVFFVGRTNIVQQKDYFRTSIAFVQHSRITESGDSEGTPVAILEASASALPVVSTLHAGIPDVVLDEKTGLLSEEEDVDAMAENMKRLLRDKSLASRLGDAGRNYIKENFTLKRHIETLSSHIKQSRVGK